MTTRIQTNTRRLLLVISIVVIHATRAEAVSFTQKKSVTGGAAGQVAWGDYDNDGDLDLLTVGFSSFGGTTSGIAKIYEYDNGAFTEDTAAGAGLDGVVMADADWGDYDNDGDLDLFVSGQSNTGTSFARIYQNNSGTFSVKKSYSSFSSASGEWGDSDNDGDLDLLMAGDYLVWPGGGRFLQVYEYDGSRFKQGSSFGATHNGSVEWGDIDNDGDLDALATGSPAYPSAIASIYQNTDANFTLSESMTGLEYGDASFGDYDGDGDLDVALMGSRNPSGGGLDLNTKLYENTGIGLSETTVLTGVESGQLAWGDYDNDGDLDLLVAGTTTGSSNGTLTRVYRNDGGGTFTVDSNASNDIVNVYEASVAWGDYDRDGDLDIAISGYSSQTPITRIYESDAANTGSANTPPQPPMNLQSTLLGTSVRFSWSSGSDAETDASALTYNLRVGTYAGGGDVVGSMTISGQPTRLVDEYGNTNHNRSWTIHNLTGGPYYWSVQSIDTGFASSAFVSAGPVDVIPPDNDDCENAIDVVNGTYEFDNIAASTDGPDEPTQCTFVQGGEIGADVWFRYTPSCDGTVHVSLCESNYDTAVAVYYIYGACPFIPSASFCNDDSCGTQSELDVPAIAGQPFMIRVGGFNGATGQGTLSISQPNVSNDSCENAITSSSAVLSTTSNLGCATNDGNSSCDGTNSADVWYAYTAPTTGTLRIRTCNSNDFGGDDMGTDTILAVFSDCPGGGGTEIACNDDWPSGNYINSCPGSDVGATRDSAVAMPITIGETVYIRVSHYYFSTPGEIFLTAFVSPPNDDCFESQTITDGQTLGTTVNSTNNGTSSSGPSALNTDVWYQYTATCTGLLRANTCGSEALDSVDTVLSTHDACPEFGDTHETAINDDVAEGNDSSVCGASGADSALLQPVTLGETVTLRVSRHGTSSSGEFLLNLSCHADCDDDVVPDDEEPDTDGDTVIDDCDVCPGADDAADSDGDGTPDGCDLCPGLNDVNDADADGVPDGCDTCVGFDDFLDCNNNGVADDCELQVDPSGFAALLSDNTTGFADSNFIGVPDDTFVGIGGQTVEFDFSNLPIVDGPGPDFSVYEVDFGNAEFSSVDILVSSDGVNYLSLRFFASPAVPIAGDTAHGSASFARSYDLSIVGLSTARYIRIVGDGDGPAGTTTGFDLDAVGAIHLAASADCNANNIPDTCDPDADGDDVPDICDVCPGFDDKFDSDGDEIPNGCDTCAGGWASGDADGNGIVNVDDYAEYNACLQGPNFGTGDGCECFDFDIDGDIDLRDYAEFQMKISQ